MLFRKMLREMKNNFGQFFSLFLLSFLAISMYTLLKSGNIGAYKAMDKFHGKSNLADGLIYGENFTEDNLLAVRELTDIKDAQLRVHLSGSSVEQGNAQIEIYLEEENIVTRPYIIKGEEFNPDDTDSLWLSERFADAWDLAPGDTFAFTYNGTTIEKTIAGLIASPEYEYMCASEDLETDYANIAYIYMAYEAFPAEKHEIQYTQMIFTTGRKDVMSLEGEISDAIDGNYAVFVKQDSISGIKVLKDELNQHEQFAYGFTMVFLVIAILVIMTTMSRMVDKQRTQIGTMNALGMKRSKITRHYMGYSFTISTAGVLVGLIAGPLLMGQTIVNIFKEYYTLPDWKADYDFSFLAAAVIIVLACTGTAYLSCRKLLKINPSESLRPAPPKAGRRCIFEKLPFWNRLGFTSQYDLRDISRAKLRTFMGIFGTACGTMILTCGLACDTTLDNVYGWTFEKLQNYDYDMQFSEGITVEKADEMAEELNGELVMMDSIEIAAQPHALSDDKITTSLTVTEGKGYYGITNVAQEVVSIKPGTIAVTSKLAEKLGVSVGDKVYWHINSKNEWYTSTIGVINRNPTTAGITMLRDDYGKTGNTFRPAVLYTDENVMGYEDENEAVTATHNKTEILKAYKENMQIMYVLVVVFILFAVVLILVVLYNSGNLSFNERVKEFATLKVMGFGSGQIRHLLTVQNLWLSVIGVILGSPFAGMILQYMFDSNGDSYDYKAVIGAGDYIISAIVVLGVSAAVSFFFSKRIKKLDMVEVLKGME